MSASHPPRPSEILSANLLSLMTFALGIASGIVAVHVSLTASLVVGVISLLVALVALVRRERVAKIAVITAAVVVILPLVIRASVGEL